MHGTLCRYLQLTPLAQHPLAKKRQQKAPPFQLNKSAAVQPTSSSGLHLVSAASLSFSSLEQMYLLNQKLYSQSPSLQVQLFASDVQTCLRAGRSMVSVKVRYFFFSFFTYSFGICLQMLYLGSVLFLKEDRQVCTLLWSYLGKAQTDSLVQVLKQQFFLLSSSKKIWKGLISSFIYFVFIDNPSYKYNTIQTQLLNSTLYTNTHPQLIDYAYSRVNITKYYQSFSGMICLTLQAAPLVKSSTLVHQQQKQGKIIIYSSSNWLRSLGTIIQSCGLLLSSSTIQWYLPKLFAIFRYKEVLVNPLQNIFLPFTIVLSGLGIPRQRSRNLPCLGLAFSFLANFSLLYCSSCFLTMPMTAEILSYQLFLRSWFIFLQVQLPVQRQTKHLRAAYCQSSLNFYYALLFSLPSAISYSINERILVAATEFFSIASLIDCTYFSCYFLSAVAYRSIYVAFFMAFLFLRRGSSTYSIFA